MSQSDFVTRGQGLVASGQYQEAVKVCRLGLLGRPTTVDGRIVLGQALLALKRYDEVLAEMRVALELDHGSLVAQAIKGEALIKKGDFQGAVDLLTGLVRANPGDAKLAELLADARTASGRPPQSAGHPAVGFVGGNHAAGETKHYPQPAAAASDEHTHNDEDGNYRETNVSTPIARKRITEKPVAEATPPPNVLAVGDRSGTVEVDPEVDGVELEDDDFGALAAPPRAGRGRGPDFDEPRGSIKRSSGGKAALPKPGGAGPRPAPSKKKKVVTSVELDDDELIEVSEMPVDRKPARGKPVTGPKPGASRVRDAVNIAAGQFPDAPLPAPRPTPSPVAIRPLASMLANQPHLMEVQPIPQAPPRPIAAAMPTAIGLPSPAATRPTLALQVEPQGQQVVDAMFGTQVPAPAWAKATVAAQPMPPMSNGMEIGPSGLPSLLDFDMSSSSAVPVVEPTNSSASRPMKAGIKKGRSRFQIIGWIIVGALVIGGGVFAGFQIRSMRLAKQIEAARTHATDTAKSDTWRGWLAARDSLGGIAQASATIENRAALARARALLAYEFGEGVPEAKIAAEALGDKGGLDGAIASGYVALALGEPKLGKLAVERARAAAPDDAATSYIAGELALLDGDIKTAIKSLTDAASKDDRALYHLGLARAYASIDAWDTALASLKRALELSKDHPGALIDRAMILAASGRLGETTTEARKQLDAIVAEGTRPLADQPRGVSPMQVALAHVAIARVELAQGDRDGALKDTIAGVTVGVDDQRLAETVCETLLGVGPPALTDATKQALQRYPTSRRVQLVVAQDLMARGRAGEALDYLTGKGDSATGLARGLAVRGDAKLAAGDLEGARADYDLASKQAPQLEAAQLGRALVDLARGDVEIAKLAIEPKFAAAPNPSIGMLIAYAKVLDATGEAASRDKARALLDKAVTIGGVDLARAQLELARLEVETGAAKDARLLLAPLVKAGNADARLELALLLIEDQDAPGGHTELEALLRDSGARPPVLLALEAARGRTLVGDHAGAIQLLDGAEKMPGVVGWKLDRERARLAVRKNENAKAGELISRALDTSGRDLDTLMVAADVAYVDLQTDHAQNALVEKLRTAAKQRLGDVPEAEVIAGKLALAIGAVEEAEGHYRAAKAAYEKQKSTRRRMAQVEFGFAIVLVDRNDLPAARDRLDNVEVQDPSIYDAFLYHAQIALDGKDAKKALELARTAVHLDPDLVQGWLLLGQAASAAGQGKQVVEAIARVTELAPNSDELKELSALKK